MSLDPLPPSIRREIEARVEADPTSLHFQNPGSPRSTALLVIFLIGVAIGWLAQFWG